VVAQAKPPQTPRRPLRLRRVHGIAIGLVVMATALRLWGLKWGLPDATHLFSYHPDEYHSLRGLLSLAIYGDLNPHFFNYGSLYLYLVAAAGVIAHPRVLLSLTDQSFPEALRVWTLDARVVSVIAGVVTVLVIYLLARLIWGTRPATLSALLLALVPLHVLNSHYGTVDVTQALFITLALLFSLRLMRSGRWQDCAWAGAMTGLAASAKYNGIAVVIAPLAAVLLAGGGAERARWHLGVGKKILIVLGCALLAFALTSPFTFLAWSEAKADIAYELEHMRIGEPWEVAAEPSALLFHAKNLLIPGAGPVAVLAVIGVVMAFTRRRRELLPIALFAIVWTVMIGTAQVRYARYEVSLLPALIILGTVPIAGLLSGRRWHRGGGYVLAALCLVPAVYWSVQTCAGLAQLDPRGDALETIRRITPEDANIGLVREPWFDVPPVDYCNGGRILRQNFRMYQRAVRPLVITDLDQVRLEAERPHTFILSGFNTRARLRAGDEEAVRFILALLGSYKRSHWHGGLPLQYVPWELGSDWLYPWPEIQIFLRKGPPDSRGGG